MNSFPRWLIVASALAMLAVLCGGVWFYLAREQHLRQEAETDLQAIAQMKVDQIAAWRAERLNHAGVLMESSFIQGAINRWMAEPQDEDAQKILGRFRTLKEHHGYHDVMLVGSEGKVRLSLSHRLGSLHEEAAQALVVALRERRPVMTDLHVGPGDLPHHVDVVAPFYRRTEKMAEPVGAVIFQVDARQFLYPLIQFWPRPSRSAETLLVRRDGDAILFLNELRHQNDTALKLRIPLSRTDVPAVMAVLGKEGFVQGKDYRGVEVLSVLKAIPHSPWFMVAKVDEAEALAVWRSPSVLIVALVLAIMASLVTAVGVVWQRNAKAHYRTLYQAEAARRESEQRYRITLMSVGDGVIVTDSKGRVDLLNEVAEGLTGWRQEEARGKPLEEVFHIINEETRESVDNPVSRVMREGLIVGLANHTVLIAQDGTERPIADSGAPIRDENGAITGVVLVFSDRTEERAAQEALRESEERFRLSFENANIGVCLVDTQGKLLRVNNEMCEMFGYSRSEMEGMTVNDIAHPEDLILSPRFIDRALARDADRADFEKRYIHKEGHIVWGRVSSTLVRDRLGHPLYFISHVQDIAERKLAEEALRESEERYRAVFDNAGIGIDLLDQDGKIIQVNQSLLDMLGYTEEELYELTFADITYPDDREISKLKLESLVAGEIDSYRLEKRYLRKDGSIVWGDLWTSSIRELTGEYTGTIGVIADITERKKAEEALRQSEERLSLALEGANLGVWDWDLVTGKSLWSERRLRMLGYGPNEFEPTLKNWKMLVHPDDWPRVSGEMKRHLEGKLAIYETEYRMLNKSGDWQWVLARGKVIEFDAHGKPTRMAGIVADVTERKRAEEALRKSEEKLKSVLRAAPVGIGVVVDRVIKEANDHFCEMTGYSREELLDANARLIYATEEDFEFVGREKYKQIAEKGTGTVETRWRRKDGRVIDVLLSSSAIDPADMSLGVTFTALDITERKQIEKALRESEKRYRTLFESAADAILVLDAEGDNAGQIVSANQAAAEMHGCTPDELLTLRISDLDTPESAAKVAERLARLRRGEVLREEVTHRKKDGTVFPLEINARLLELAGHKYIMAIDRDISDRKLAEKALRESEERFRIAARSATDLIWEWDIFTGRLEWYGAIDALLGYSSGEFPRTIEAWEGIIHPDEHDRVMAAVDQHLETRVPYVEEYRVRRKDGTFAHWTDKGEGLWNEQGNAFKMIGVCTDVTERKQKEEALRESEEQYRLLAETARDIIVVHDMQGRIRYVNQAGLDFGGYSQTEASQKLVTDFIAVEHLPAAAVRREQRAAGNSHVYLYETEVVNRAGQRIGVEVSSAPIIRKGTVSEILIVARDITERKRADEAVRQSEERYRAIFNSVSVGADMVDNRGRFLQVNDTLTQMLGYTRDELLNMTIFDISHPDDIEASRVNHDKIVLGELRSYRFQKRYIRKDGHVVWADVSVSALRDPGGGHVATIAVISDISERVKAEAVRARLASAIEQAAEVVVITDVNGNIQYVNPAFHKITGYAPEEAIGQNPRILKSGEHDTKFYEQMWDTIKGGNTWTGRLVNKKKDGSLYHEEVTISPVKDASGKIANFVAVKRDMTEQLELSKQLFQAQKLEAVGTLASGVAHDFNNLLQVVQGYSELILADRNLPDEHRNDLGKINTAAKNGADLVRRLLTFSRKTEFKPRPLNLNRQIEQLEKILSRTIPKMINMELILADDLAVINADPTQMEQILMNVAVNARDAMPEGGRLIIETENVTVDEQYAKTHLGAKPGGYVLLSVSDTGQGIEKETLEHIFEPFFTTKGPGEGTGLGLAMVYGIVQQHGGYIQCYSEVAEGTTFKIYLPALVSDEEVQETTDRPMPRGGSEAILLVDDEELIRDLGSRILRKAGYKVITASNGKEALKVYQARSLEISLVILDLIMPEMGGNQCLEGLLKLDPSVKVLIASGYAADGATREALQSGAKGFVNKPYDIRQVLETVRSTLDEEQGKPHAAE